MSSFYAHFVQDLQKIYHAKVRHHKALPHRALFLTSV